MSGQVYANGTDRLDWHWRFLVSGDRVTHAQGRFWYNPNPYFLAGRQCFLAQQLELLP